MAKSCWGNVFVGGEFESFYDKFSTRINRSNKYLLSFRFNCFVSPSDDRTVQNGNIFNVSPMQCIALVRSNRLTVLNVLRFIAEIFSSLTYTNRATNNAFFAPKHSAYSSLCRWSSFDFSIVHYYCIQDWMKPKVESINEIEWRGMQFQLFFLYFQFRLTFVTSICIFQNSKCTRQWVDAVDESQVIVNYVIASSSKKFSIETRKSFRSHRTN